MILYKYLPLFWNPEDVLTDESMFVKRCRCIKDETFFFSKPYQLNDPYDCNPHFQMMDNVETIDGILDTMTEDEIAFLLKRFPRCNKREDISALVRRIMGSEKTDEGVKGFTVWSIQALAADMVNVKAGNLGVLSLTENPANIVMWAQYAANHTGVCLEIEIPGRTHSLRKVNYTEEQPEFEVYEAMDERHGRLMDLFYTKSKHWEFEAEWRMVAREGGAAKAVPGATVRKIIYGINATRGTKDKVAELVGHEIPKRQVKMKRNYILTWEA